MSNDSRRTGGRTRTDGTDGGLARRRLLVTGAAGWTAMSVAGCSDDGEDTSGETDTAVTTATTTTDDTSTDGSDGGTGDTETPTPTPSPTPSPTPTGTECEDESLFGPGQEIGFLAGVFDTATGEPMGPEAVSSVRLEFADEEPADREMAWRGDHSDVVSGRWGAVMSDTGDLEPGPYRYEVVVTPADAGRAEERAVGHFRLVSL